MRTVTMIAAIVGTLLAGTLSAQRRTPPPVRNPSDPIRPNWLERKASDVGWLPLPAADRPPLLTRWAEFDRLFAAADAMGRPQGFTIAPGAIAYGEMPVGKLYNFYLRYLFLNGSGRTGGEGSANLGIWENPVARNIWVVDSGPASFKDAQGDMYLERSRGQSFAGLPPNAIVFEGPWKVDPKGENKIWVLLTASDEAPWSDVSRERVLKSLLAQAQKDADEVEKLYADPNYRKMIESMDRGASDRNLASVRGPVTRLTNELAALSTAERAAPAWVQITNAGTYAFAAPGTPGFQHVIADRPDYYRANGSRTALRAMLIRFGQTSGYYVAMDRAIDDSFRAFDWAAAARLLSR